MANLNCIKAVLAEKGIMSKWLAKTLNKDPATVSKWCNNHSQPDLYTLARIAEVLDVDIHKLICHTGKSSVSCPLKPSDSAPLKHSTMPP